MTTNAEGERASNTMTNETKTINSSDAELAQDALIDLEAAREYVASHEDDDEMGEDELEEVFVKVYGRTPDDDDRLVGIWSLICAGV